MHATILRRPLSVVLIVLLVFTMLPLVSTPPAAHAALPPASADYNSVVFVDDMWGWVAGTNGTILRTRNGGNNWEVLSTPTTETFVAVSFVDRSLGWALTVNARVYRTLNGGDTWLGPSAPSWRGSSIPDYHQGIAYDLEFVSASTGFLTARAYVPDSGRPGVCGLVYRTDNGGLTWTRVLEEPNNQHPDDQYPEGDSIFRGLDFVSETHGWVVGVDKWPTINRSLVYRTTNGGSSWTSAGTGITGSVDLHGVSFANTSVGLVVGDGGAIRKSTNGGATWATQTSGTTNRLNDVFMLDAQTAWAVGENGTLQRTINGGTTWSSGWVQTAISVSLRSVQVLDLSTGSGWIVGSGGRVRIVDTDGQNWWTPEPGPEVAGLSSATHPAEDSWYGEATGLPSFSWDVVSGAEGYSVSFSTDRTVVPTHQVMMGPSETEWSPAETMSDGVWYFNVKAKADGGNWGSPATYIVHYDATVPSGSIVLAGGAVYTKAHDVSVASSVGWGPSGAEAIAFSHDGGVTWGAWNEYRSPINVTLPFGDGEKTVHARFRNGAGTVSGASASDSIILDTFVPSASVSINDGASATSTRDVEVSVSVNEWGVSGPGQMCFSTDGGINWDAWRTYSTQPTAITLPSGDGSKAVHVQVRDAAGNTSLSASDSIVLDTAAPEITTIDSPSHPDENVWHPERNVALEWSVESLSGVSSYSYTWNSGAVIEPDTLGDTFASTYAIEDVTDGEWYFSVRARNVLGVWGPSETRVVRIDGTKPLGQITINGGNSYTDSHVVKLESDVAWGPSGEDAIRHRVDGQQWSDWQTYSSLIDVSLTGGDGEKTIEVQFRDAADNVSETVDGTVIYDTVIPSASITVAGAAEFTADRSVTVANDVDWGRRQPGTMRFRVNGGQWSEEVAFEAHYVLDLIGPDGVKTIDALFFDDDERTIVASSVSITLDTYVPTGSISINGGATATSSTNVQVGSSITWGVSGAGEMRFSINGGTWGSWRAYATPAAVALPSGDGIKTVAAQFRDKAGNLSATRTATIELLSSRETPIAGSNRYDTAVLGSREAYPNGLSTTGKRTVVIATGQNWPDALGGSALAGAVDGPILLVEPGSVPAAVSRELTRLGARNAIIVGGEAAVSGAVQDALNRQLAGKVERLAGPNRYQTADRIALRVISELGTSYDGRAFVATGGNFPDALAAAPLAAANGWPLFLSDPDTGRLPAGSLNAMKPRVKNVVILGGTAVVSPGVETTLKNTFGTGNVRRIAGSGRYDTARQVAAYGVANSDLSWGRVGISTGTNFPDALAGGVLMGKVGGVVLLTESHRLSGETSSALTANRSRIMNVTYFGGTSAVSEAVRTQVRSALRW